MLTRALLVLTLLFSVFSMHQVAHPSEHGAHEDHDPGLHLCIGFVVTAAGLAAIKKLRPVAAESATPRRAPAMPAWLPSGRPAVPPTPELSRLCVLRL